MTASGVIETIHISYYATKKLPVKTFSPPGGRSIPPNQDTTEARVRFGIYACAV